MKKMIIAAVAAVLALTVFTGCEYTAKEYTEEAMSEAAVDLTTAKVGYGLTVTVPEADGDPLVIEGSGYSQSRIELPYAGFPFAELKFETTGKITVGFLPAGADPWAGRIAGADVYVDAGAKEAKVAVPANAAYITIGSNNDTATVKVTSITLKAE